MSKDQRTDRSPTRRSTLQALGTLLATGSVAGAVSGQQDAGSYRVTQGDRTLTAEPLSGDLPVEELYSYRLPDKYAGTGVHDVADGPYYESVGTRDIQREATTITFLYDGPNGVSLVTVHGMSTTDGGGGSVTWELLVRAGSAEWLVKDDEYRVRETGERADSNYDDWDTDGDEHRVDWTWSGEATDGGVFGHLDEASALVIDPFYNGESTLHGEYYADEVTGWQFLSGDAEDPDRTQLALDEPVAITGLAADDQPIGDVRDGPTEDGDEDDEEDDAADEREAEDEEETEEGEVEDDDDEEEAEEAEEEDEDVDDDEDDEDDDELEETIEDALGKVNGNGKAKGHEKGRRNGHEKGRGEGHEKGRGNGHD